MAAITPDASGHDKLGPLASRYVDVAELPWQATKYPGIEMKVLMKDEDAGLITALFRCEAGARLPLTNTPASSKPTFSKAASPMTKEK